MTNSVEIRVLNMCFLRTWTFNVFILSDFRKVVNHKTSELCFQYEHLNKILSHKQTVIGTVSLPALWKEMICKLHMP